MVDTAGTVADIGVLSPSLQRDQMAETREPGLITGAMVISLLTLASPADLTRLVREGFKAVPGGA